MLLRQYATDLYNLFYPHQCVACGVGLLKGEHLLCRACTDDLPQTSQWLHTDNALMQRFAGRVPLQAAAAFLYFRKQGTVQHLLHQLKYKGRTEAGLFIGNLFGHRLCAPGSVITNIDLIVPVPLHWKKQQKRGYNQCDPFAEGLSQAMGVPWSATAIERVRENVSQTTQSKFDRWGNVEDIFAVKDATQLAGKHILLVDDVVTTGATAESCLQTILKTEGTRVSFAAMAYALT